MVKNFKLFFSGLSMLVMVCLIGFISGNKGNNSDINGAWKLQQGTVEQVLILSDGYFMHSTFDIANKKFIQSRGGVYQFSGKELATAIEFNTLDKNQIGEKIDYAFALNKQLLNTDLSGKKANWTMIDKGDGSMAGTWRISGRMQEGKVVFSPPRARKTLKILTGTRFQWAAINAETKEFFGTGGGSYTFKDGKYTENIEFFSRDSSRVNVSLTFDGKIEEGHWHHSGMSSRGAPIYEIWSRVPKQ